LGPGRGKGKLETRVRRVVKVTLLELKPGGGKSSREGDYEGQKIISRMTR